MMIEQSYLALLATGMFFGVIHAFDADHIMAMASFSGQHRDKKSILTHTLKWGMGHGGVLVILGLLLIFVGFQLPQWFVHYAEILVGVVLIYLGLKLILFLHHSGVFNLQSQLSKIKIFTGKHDHTSLFIGMLHGVAGSAPLLVIMPNMQQAEFILHISLFSLGCLVGMFCFGYAFSLYQTQLKNITNKVANIFTKLLGLSSIGLGTFWIVN
ncbi:urease accessory protein UreH domain-containing protein [Thalassotalea sp. PLHSN55]|uniref:urease accessory protein UreH domain-containing protein n=1 Tax=Thalassotalea sp. PLHSN55 TaxID=3435888 RepID=UPI003F868F0B